MDDTARGHLRIGELSQRVGVSPELLRAWENRYGLISPARSPGGYRLYSHQDEIRVRRMQEHMARGLSAAQAALAASERGSIAASDAAPAGAMSGLIDHLAGALERFDESAAQEVLDRLFASFSLETLIRDAILPFLRHLGDEWEAGRLTVAQEHFASGTVRARLLGLARNWDRGVGPRAVLATPPGELHDLGLIAFGLALRHHGWRITYLGGDTPIGSIQDTVDAIDSDVVVMSAVTPRRFLDQSLGIARLARSARVFLGGVGAHQDFAGSTGCELTEADPTGAARRLASLS